MFDVWMSFLMSVLLLLLALPFGFWMMDIEVPLLSVV